VVLAGGVVPVLAATARERAARDRGRFALLADPATIADGRLTLEQTAERLGELLVPALADICMLDVVREGGLRRLAVKASGPLAAEREARLLARRLPSPSSRARAASRATGRLLLLRSVSDEGLRAAAHDEDDLALPRSLDMTANVTVPLSARGRTLGALTLLLVDRSHRRYTEEDLRFVEVLAGRVALALDNAGLFSELATMEAQLTTALATLSEAVTVQNPHGNLTYANQAAAELLGYTTPQEPLATPAAVITQQYDGFALDEETWMLVVGDVTGRGAPARR
jgi:PAS domain-containing protein